MDVPGIKIDKKQIQDELKPTIKITTSQEKKKFYQEYSRQTTGA